MGPAVMLGGGVLLLLIFAFAGEKEAKAKELQPIPPGPEPVPPGPPIVIPAPPMPPGPLDIDELPMPPPPGPPGPGPVVPSPNGPVLVTPSGPILLTSPFKQIPTKNWSKFTKVMAKGKEGTITKGARYGMFLFGVRRLADLGLVSNVKRGTYRGQTVWTGTWIPPYSEAKFLTSSKLQYRTFIKSMLQYAKKYAAARKQKPQLFRLGNVPLTMSGFLAFAHLAGFMGAINSLKSKKIRPDTLAFVKKVNGLF